MWDAFNDKVDFLSGRLGTDGAETEEGCNETVYFDMDILEPLEAEARGCAAEKTELIDGDDAPVGDRPDIKVVVGPCIKEDHPYNESPCGKKEKCNAVGLGKLLYKIGNYACLVETEVCDEWDEKDDNGDEELSKEYKPMLTHNREYGLIFFEVYAFRECLHI